MSRVVSVPAPYDRIVQKQHDKQCANRQKAVMDHYLSWLETPPHKRKAIGSSPIWSTIPGRSRMM